MDDVSPKAQAAHYAIEAALMSSTTFEQWTPTGVKEALLKLKRELEKIQPATIRHTGGREFKQVISHVANLIDHCTNGRPPDAPELWTLSFAVDLLCEIGHGKKR